MKKPAGKPSGKPGAPKPPRRLPLGFDSVVTVGPGETLPVNSQPQQPFQGNRLLVPSAIAAFFLIQDIKIGNKSQLVSSTAVSAQGFSEVGVDDNVQLDKAQTSQFITLSVTDTDAVAHRFTATLFGTAWEI